MAAVCLHPIRHKSPIAFRTGVHFCTPRIASMRMPPPHPAPIRAELSRLVVCVLFEFGPALPARPLWEIRRVQNCFLLNVDTFSSTV